jgi:hypothetical protein
MITFSQLGSLGRLGNQLFQYAALRSLSLEKDYEVAIPNPKTRHWHGQNCLLNEFNIEARFLSPNDSVKYRYMEPSPFSIDSNFFNLQDGADIYGFFQSIYYFEKHEEQIKKELTPKQKHVDSAREHIESLRRKYNCDIVSIHVRRGDNTDNTDPNQVELNNFYCTQGDSQMSKDSQYYQYITNAMSNFENVKFLVFSGGNRHGNNNISDMQWCKNSFKGEQFLFSEGRTVLEDFCMIMNCDHNILSHVSSYGWWAAYLNQNSKSTIAPTNYHPDMPDFSHRYKFYPPHWRLI